MRHAAHGDLGHVLSGRRDSGPLTPPGERQAAALGRRLGAQGVQRIEASPRRRCRETAAALARRCGVDVRVDERLDEIDFGRWSGAAFDDLEADPGWTLWNRERALSAPPGGESLIEAQARAARWLESVRLGGETTVGVSHADVIKALVALLLGAPPQAFARMEVAPGSITALTLWPDGGGRLDRLNEVPDE